MTDNLLPLLTLGRVDYGHTTISLPKIWEISRHYFWGKGKMSFQINEL